MKSPEASLADVAEALLPSGLDTVELFLKEGRSRKASLGSEGQLVSLHHERGWAVRASGDHASLFCCGSGRLAPRGRWPAPDGFPIKLPSPRPVSAWREPAGLGAPLSVEHEALEILQACARELDRELPASRLLRAALEDGESSSSIVSTRGVEASLRQRTATLHLEAALGSDAVTELVGARDVKAFDPRALARRLADRLLIRRDGSTGERDRGVFLLAPPVATRILASLLPLFLDHGSERGRTRSRALVGSSGRLGSSLLTIVDDGRLPDGLFSAPVDGEGMPTGRTVLVERGELRSPLGWVPADRRGGDRGFGCVRRPSYRDVPGIAPSHLFIEPDRRSPAGALLAGMSRGHYLLEAQGPGHFDLEGDYFQLTVGGFAVRAGRPTSAVAGARLAGKVSRLLMGVQAVARDLAFVPIAGLLGSPSLLVEGLEINGV